MRIMRRKKSNYEPFGDICNIYIQLTEEETKGLYNLVIRGDQSYMEFCKINKIDLLWHQQFREQLCDRLYEMLVKPNAPNAKKGG